MNPLFLNTFTGIGLFLIGVRLLTLHMQQVGQQRLRSFLARLGRSGWRLRLVGLVAGAGFQSVNALIQVVVALVHADTLSMRQGFRLVAWANLGTSFLVLVATFNYLHPLALGLIGITGVLFYVRLDRSARWGHAVGVLLALGLLFLGIDFIKAGSAGVRADPRLAHALQAMDTWPWGAWALGVLASFVAQSSLTITLVVMAIVGGGAMGVGTAGMVVLGTGLGSALSTWFLVGHLERSARQLAMYQLLFRASGSVVLALAWWGGILWGLGAHGTDPDVVHDVLAALFVGHYLVSLVLLAVLDQPLTLALARRWPPAPETLWRQPRYIHAGEIGRAHV